MTKPFHALFFLLFFVPFPRHQFWTCTRELCRWGSILSICTGNTGLGVAAAHPALQCSSPFRISQPLFGFLSPYGLGLVLTNCRSWSDSPQFPWLVIKLLWPENGSFVELGSLKATITFIFRVLLLPVNNSAWGFYNYFTVRV